MGVANDSGVDAAGRKLGDAAGDVAVGRRAIYSDADPGDDAYRSGRVCRCSGENKFGKATQDVKFKAEP